MKCLNDVPSMTSANYPAVFLTSCHLITLHYPKVVMVSEKTVWLTVDFIHPSLLSILSSRRNQSIHPNIYQIRGISTLGLGLGGDLTPITEVALMSRCSDFVTWCGDGRPSTLLGPKLAWSRQLRLGLGSVRSITSFLIFDHPVSYIIGVQSITITSSFSSSIIRVFKFYFVLFIFLFFRLFYELIWRIVFYQFFIFSSFKKDEIFFMIFFRSLHIPLMFSFFLS